MLALARKESAASEKRATATPKAHGAPTRQANPVWPALAMHVQRKCACGEMAPGDDQQEKDQAAAIGSGGLTAGALQAKLTVNQPGDPYEQEADRVADTVMRMSERQTSPISAGEPLFVQRRCAECDEERRLHRLSRTALGPEEKEEKVQTKRVVDGIAGSSDADAAPPIVHEVLQEQGEPLDRETRHFMESRFGYRFGSVRVHSGPRAGASARSVRALAYTVGRDIVFGSGQFAPRAGSGRRLLAHELAHVVQQASASPARSASPVSVAQSPPGSLLSRQNTAQTTSVLSRGAVANVQFSVDGTMNSTRVGPVSGQHDISAIVNRLTTIRSLAQVLLPLWNSATPFTPPGGGAPVPLVPLTTDELAKGLLVYNRYRLAIPPAAVPPVMTNWKIGMRFPLPIRIDATTSEGVLHPDPIRSMAGTFDPAWTHLLDELPAVLPAQPAADLARSVGAFLTNEPSPMGRGIHLGARAVANAQDSREFILEAFNQVGAGAFELALAFMDYLVNRDISLLASQEAGAAIFNRIHTLLGAPPAAITAAQQASLNRATGMLGRVAGVQARPDLCVPNRQLTWTNFAGAVPGGSTFEAETHFHIDQVAFQGSQLFQATLNQGASWVRPRSAQPGNVAVNGCQPNITSCQAFFNGLALGTVGATFNVPGGPSAACPAAITPAATTATNLGQCTTVIGAICTAARVADSPRLLRHEQLHFDIPCVLVHKANAARASGAAVSLASVRSRANTLTVQYDNQTNHGCNANPQAHWESDVASGLPGQHFP